MMYPPTQRNEFPRFGAEPAPLTYAAHSPVMEQSPQYAPSAWYRLMLPDPATPSFCTFEKPYFGPAERIVEFWKRTEEKAPLTICRLLEFRKRSIECASWDHENIWQSIYSLKAGRIVIEQALLECLGRFYLCIRPDFYGLREYSRIQSAWLPVPDPFWGTPGVLTQEGDVIRTQLFISQNSFDRVEDGLAWIRDPKKLDLGPVCDEIYGDG